MQKVASFGSRMSNDVNKNNHGIESKNEFRFQKVEIMNLWTTAVGVNVFNAKQQRQKSRNQLHIIIYSLSANFSFMIFFGFNDSMWAVSNVNISNCQEITSKKTSRIVPLLKGFHC